jgi:hypothetical protein
MVDLIDEDFTPHQPPTLTELEETRGMTVTGCLLTLLLMAATWAVIIGGGCLLVEHL